MGTRQIDMNNKKVLAGENQINKLNNPQDTIAMPCCKSLHVFYEVAVVLGWMRLVGQN